MVKSNNNKAGKRTSRPVHNHAFLGVRDALLMPAPGSAPSAGTFTVGTDSGGNSNNAWVFCPLGLTSVTLGASSYTAGTAGNVLAPSMRTLFNRALDFQWYRVTRAKVVFVGNVGSTVTGILTMSGYTDPSDVNAVTFQTYVSSQSTKSFDLASSSSKELSIPIPVDSTWKKVTTNLSVPGNVYPFNAANAGSIAVLNTVTDLAFGAFGYYLAGYSSGGTATATNVGTFYIDYDVEFKGPIDAAVNK